MKLHPYQSDIIRSVREKLRDHRSTLVVAATGLGKTVVFTKLASEWTSGIVLVLAHRQELVQQASDKFWHVSEKVCHWEMGDFGRYNHRHEEERFIVASVQTMSQDRRLRKYNPIDVSLIIIDEAHHYVPGSQYQTIVDYFPRAKVVGFTATPRRHDERALGQVFESVAYQYEIAQAVDDGYLVPIRQHIVKCESLDFSKIKSRANELGEQDLSREELSKVLTQEKPLHEIAAPMVEIAGERSGLVYCVTVQHAILMAEVLNRYSGREAVVLHGKSDKEVRERQIERFKNGDVQFLCNCGLFLEGFDAPNTAVVGMARPTKSLGLYTQVMGRGTRALPGVIDGLETAEERKEAIANSDKPEMLMLDFAGNAGRHKLISAADVLGGKYDEEVREHVKKLCEQNGRRISEQLEESRVEVTVDGLEKLKKDAVEQKLTALIEEMEQAERAKNRLHVVGEAKYHTVEVSPFDDSDTEYSRNSRQAPKNGATEKQIRYLCFLGVPEHKARSYSKRQAGAVISSMKAKGA